jgi:hypothetical protein
MKHVYRLIFLATCIVGMVVGVKLNVKPIIACSGVSFAVYSLFIFIEDSNL